MSIDSAPVSCSAPLVLHFLNKSRAESVVWVLEELGVEYEIKYYRRQSDMLAPPELKKIHPLGKSPVITHNNLTIAETGNIIAYLLEAFSPNAFSDDQLDPELRQRNRYYLHYAEGSLMPVLVNKLVLPKFADMSPWYIRPIVSAFVTQVTQMWIDRDLVRHLEMLDIDLSKTASSTVWFCGGEQPTAADFAMYFPLLTLPKGPGATVPVLETILRWLKKAEERPALKAAYTRLEQVERQN